MRNLRGLHKLECLELFLIMACVLLLLVTTSPAKAAVVLTWAAPVTRVNGTPLAGSEIAGYAIIKDGAAITTVTGSTLTYTDTAASTCTANLWGVSTVDTGGLSSTPASATTPVDKVQCAPKPPTGLSAH